MSQAHAETDSGAQRPKSQRDLAIDLIKGYCVASMITGHIAAGSLVANTLHIFPKFDGASGFVLLSGLLLGIIQSARITGPGGFRAVIAQTLKRARIVYVAQILLSVAGVAAAFWFGWNPDTFPPDLRQMSSPTLILGILTMNIAPPGGDVLRLYVVFLLLAAGVYALLRQRRSVLTFVLSGAVACAGYAFPHETSLSLLGGAPSASWAGWQLLFVSAIILGWHWRRLMVAEWIGAHQWTVLLVGAGVSAIAAIASLMPADEEWLFSKYLFPPGRILVAYAVVAALYVVSSWILRALPPKLLRPVLLIGQRSLDSYIIQAFAGVLIMAALVLRPTSLTAQIAVVLIIVLCWGWAALRSRFRINSCMDLLSIARLRPRT